jgi:hypothetical protein
MIAIGFDTAEPTTRSPPITDAAGDTTMLFTSSNPISQLIAADIVKAVRTIDALALVRIDELNRQIQIDGRLSSLQASAILRGAGCDAGLTEAVAGPHVPGGSTCCGGCS